MDDLMTWLRAQLDDDEHVALAAGGENWPDSGYEMWTNELVHARRHDPARVLAEVDAKRRILDEILRYEEAIDGEWGDGHTAEEIAAGECPERHPDDIPAFRAMALPLADRAGYRPEWAPDA